MIFWQIFWLLTTPQHSYFEIQHVFLTLIFLCVAKYYFIIHVMEFMDIAQIILWFVHIYSDFWLFLFLQMKILWMLV